jgi:Domain of unknown function (DUF4440)
VLKLPFSLTVAGRFRPFKSLRLIHLPLAMLLLFLKPARAQSIQQQKLLDQEYRCFMAMIRGDTAILSKYLAEDLVYIQSNGTIETKPSLLRGIASGYLKYLYIVPEKRIASIDGTHAWIYGNATITFKVNKGTQLIQLYISFIDFFRLNRQQWQEVAWQSARVNKLGDYESDPIKPQASQGTQPSVY